VARATPVTASLLHLLLTGGGTAPMPPPDAPISLRVAAAAGACCCLLRGACPLHAMWELRVLDWCEAEERRAIGVISQLKANAPPVGAPAAVAAAAAAAAGAPAGGGGVSGAAPPTAGKSSVPALLPGRAALAAPLYARGVAHHLPGTGMMRVGAPAAVAGRIPATGFVGARFPAAAGR